jgi:hypothetical protein
MRATAGGGLAGLIAGALALRRKPARRLSSFAGATS